MSKIIFCENSFFLARNGLCKCDLTTYKPFIEDRDFTIQYQMPGIAYLQQSPNHSWNMSLIERKTEQPLQENNVENYLIKPTMDDNETYPSINHISRNINGQSNNQTIVYGNELLFSESITETTNYILNGQNNVIHEQINNKIVDYQYDAYGQQISASKTPTFGYNAEYQINNSTQYLRARTYDNSTGRMMQYDTYQGGLNPLSRNHYTYAHNNPVNLEDPSGNAVVISAVFVTLGFHTVKWVAKKFIKKAAKEYIEKNGESFFARKVNKFTIEFSTTIKLYNKISSSKVGIGIKIKMTSKKIIDNYFVALDLVNGISTHIINNYSEILGYSQTMLNLVKSNKYTLEKIYTDAGIAPDTVQQLIIMYSESYNQLAYNGGKIDKNKYSHGVQKANWHYYQYTSSLKKLFEVDENINIDNRPSEHIEEYWVPIYISHGENKTTYK